MDKSAEFPLIVLGPRPRVRGARKPEDPEIVSKPSILLLWGNRKGGGIVLIKYDKFL